MADPQDADVVFRIAGDVSGILEAVTMLNTQFAAMFQQMDEFSKHAGPMLQNIATATEKTAVASENLFSTLVKSVLSAKIVEKAVEAMVGAFKDAITALPRLVEHVAEVGDRFWVLSKQTGVSATALSEFDYVASQTGTSLDTISTTIFMMSRNLGKASTEMRAGIKGLGLDLKTLQSQRPEEAFTQILAKIHELPTAAQQAQVGMQIFGRQFRSIAQLAGQDIEKLRAKAKELGLDITNVMAEAANRFTDATDSFSRVFEGIERQIGFALLPAATKLIEGVTKILQKFFGDIGLNVAQFGETSEELVDQILAVTQELADALVPIAKLLIETFQEGVKVIPVIMGAVTAAIKDATPVLSLLVSLMKQVTPEAAAMAAGLLVVASAFDTAKVANLAYNAVVRLTGPGMEFFNGVLQGVVGGLTAFIAQSGAFLAAMNFIRAAILAATINFNVLLVRILSFAGGMDAVIAGVASFAAVLSTLLATALTVAAFFAGWKLGTWIGEITGATDAVERFIGKLMGLTDAQIDAEIAGRKQAESRAKTLKEASEAEEEATARMHDLATEAANLAATGKVSEFQLRRIATAAESFKNQGIAIDPILKEFIKGMKLLSDASQDAAENVDKVIRRPEDIAEELVLIADAAKQRAEINHRGLEAQLASFDIEASEQKRLLKEKSSDEQRYHALVVDLALKRRKLIVDAERSLNDEIKDLRSGITKTELGETLVGMDAKKAALAIDAQIEIEKKGIGVSKELKAKYDEWVLTRQAKLAADLGAIDVEATRAADERQRQALVTLQEAKIKVTLVGQQQELALLEAQTQAKIAALAKQYGEEGKLTAAYQEDVTSIEIEAEATRIQIEEAGRKDLYNRLLDLDSAYQKARIGNAESSLDATLALAQIEYKDRIQKLADGGKLTSEVLLGEYRLYQEQTKKITQEYHKIGDTVAKTLQLNGIKTRAQLNQEIEDTKKAIAQIVAARAAGDQNATKQAQKELEKRLKGLEREKSAWREVFSESVEAFSAFAEGINKIAMLSEEGSGIRKLATALDFSEVMLKDVQQILSATDAIGALIAAIHLAVDAIAALWDAFSTSPGEDVAARVGKDWGIAISEAMGDEIAKTAKDVFHGDRFAAELAHMQDIIKAGADAAGVSLEKFAKTNFNTLITRLHDVFSLIDSGQLSIAQGQKIIDDNFATLAAAGTDAYGRISDELKEVVRLNQQFGTDSKAIADFLKGQGSQLLGGFSAVAGGGTPFAELIKQRKEVDEEMAAMMKAGTQEGDTKATDETTKKWRELGKTWDELTKKIKDGSVNAKQELDDLGIQAVASFAAAVKAGVPWAEALKQIAPSLKTLKENYDALGIGIDDVALKILTTQAGIAEANPKLMAAVDGLNTEITTLDNLNSLTPETFAAIERTGARMYGQLKDAAIASGRSQEEANTDALLPIQQYLHEAEDAAKKYGFALDEATQGEIDASKQAGIWKDEQMGLNDIMISGFSAIIEALGGTIPEAWRKMAEAAKTASQDAADAATGAADEASTATQDAAEDSTDAWEKHFGNVKDEIDAQQGEWRRWAAEAARAAQIASGSIDGAVSGALDDVSAQLESTDWSGWARDAAEAAEAAKDAVDTVSFGSSPGGIKEIPLQLALARQAATEFSRHMVAQMTSAKIAATSLAGAAWSPTSVSFSGAQASRYAAAANAPSVVIQAGAFPISTWSAGSEVEMIKKKLTPAVLRAIQDGGSNYAAYQSLNRSLPVRR